MKVLPDWLLTCFHASPHSSYPAFSGLLEHIMLPSDSGLNGCDFFCEECAPPTLPSPQLLILQLSLQKLLSSRSLSGSPR